MPPDDEFARTLIRECRDDVDNELRASGFRSPSINRSLGGARGSQHSKGMAADIYVPDMSIAVLIDKIQSLHLPFDQLIDEFGSWVHVSHDPTRSKQRAETLRARIESGKTVYHTVKGI